METQDQRKLKQNASHNSSDIAYKSFMNPYKKCTKKSYLFLVTDATLVF